MDLLEEALNSQIHKPLDKSVSLVKDPDTKTERFQPLAFENAVDFLYVFDRSLREGKKTLHPWQEESLRFLSNKDVYKFRVDSPLVFYLCATNGSGKDAFVIAGFAAFALCCWKRYKIVITSSSDQQLDTQTRSYITNLLQEVNLHLRQEWGVPDVIKIKTETFKSQTFRQGNGETFSLTGSEILTFVTKEGGKAEGHHPYPDADEGEGVILVANEAKTIPQEIFDHFAKCTYNIFLKVSSAGEAREHFYNGFTTARDWEDGYIPGAPFKRLVTYKDCPHITEGRIKAEIIEHGGEDSDWFRKTRKSEFVSTDGNNVISSANLVKCLKAPRGKIDLGLPRKAGLDLGGGGDPSSLWVFDNNICIGKRTWNFKDTEMTVDLLAGDSTKTGLFTEYGLLPENITGDDNGIGQAIIDGLRRKGWEIRQFRAQHSAINKVRFLNRGAEIWFRVKRLIEEGILNFNGFIKYIPNNPELDPIFRQLTSRHYTESNGKQKLLSKPEEKAQGFISPNDADAIMIAFADVDIYEFIENKNKAPIESPKVRAEVLGSEAIVNAQFELRNTLLQQQLLEDRSKALIESNNDITSILSSIYGQDT